MTAPHMNMKENANEVLKIALAFIHEKKNTLMVIFAFFCPSLLTDPIKDNFKRCWALYSLLNNIRGLLPFTLTTVV